MRYECIRWTAVKISNGDKCNVPAGGGEEQRNPSTIVAVVASKSDRIFPFPLLSLLELGWTNYVFPADLLAQ